MNALPVPLPVPTPNLQTYLQAVSRFPMLSEQEERALAVAYQERQDLEAAWRLVTSHLRFVVKIARGYQGYGLPQEDLIQEGNVGLMKAVKRFDPAVGVRLAAFAVHWIRAEIHEYVLRNWRIVKVATTKAQRKLFFNLRGAKKRLGWLSAGERETVAEELDVRAEDVAEMEQRLAAHDAALDAEDEEGRPAPTTLADLAQEPGTALAEAEWRERAGASLHQALARLDPRSRDIVVRRWLEEPKAKLRELAEIYGISAERVRQIEAEAFAAIRGEIGDELGAAASGP